MGIVKDPRAPYQERIISCFGASHTAPKRARFATRFGSLKNSVKKLSTAYPSQADPLCEYTDYGHDVHMTHYATGGGDISWIHVKNA
jgi:hypothetical protein